MERIKINTNEELFNRFKALSNQTRALGAIVQNDIVITPGELKEWIELTQQTIKELNNLQIEVIKHCEKT